MKNAIVATVPSDSHTWNLVYLSFFLKEHGYEVINLGACTPVSLIIKTCKKYQPNLLVISSVNGHGYFEGAALMTSLNQASLHFEFSKTIGGNLVTNGKLSDEKRDDLLQLGYDNVFEGEQSIPLFTLFLNKLEAAGFDESTCAEYHSILETIED